MAQKFAPAIQVFKTATTLAQIINETAIIEVELHKYATGAPADYANWHDHAENLAKHRPLFVACCNTFRGERLVELSELWTSRTGDVMEKLTIDLLKLISITKESVDIAFEVTQEVEAQPVGIHRRTFIVLEALLLILETIRCLSSLQSVLSQQYPGDLDFKLLQPLLFREPSYPLKLMHDIIEEGLLCLHGTDDSSWEHVGSKFHTWASGQFDEPLTLDFILARDVSPDMAQGLQVGLGRILFFIGPHFLLPIPHDFLTRR